MGCIGKLNRYAVLLVAWAIALVAAPAADAAVGSVFDGAVSCSVEADGVRFCGGDDTTVTAFDGATIDVNVALPPAPASGPDGNFPLIGMWHGYGGTELGLGQMRRFVDRGYATVSMSDRGFGFSCGAADPDRTLPACLGHSGNHVKLIDSRFEVRDAQELIGRLVDEGLGDPDRVGTSGGSYGGGLSMSLAALKNRKAMPNGSLVPWSSPDGTPLRISAAAPRIPWSDLAYSLMPNGRTLDYVVDAPYTMGPIGVMKQSFVAGLYASGQAAGTYAAPGTDPDADLITWFGFINAGEPYDSDPLASDITDEVMTNHSSYYIDHSTRPAPLLISNGWTDDIFPADEALRFYNRTRTEYPGADISLFFLDYGHQRGQNKSADVAQLSAAENAFFDFYLKGEGPQPPNNVTTLTQECGGDSQGPFSAPSWPQLAPGEIRLESAAAQTILVGGGDPQIGQAFDPISGDGACATTSGDDVQGLATYRLPAAPAEGFTLMGAPTVIADIASPGPHSQIAARLLDVGPDGQQTLIGRALYRAPSGVEATRQVFQLHPNGYRFEQGHVAKLELLPHDSPYSRPTNSQAPITVANLELRLPVLEEPGSAPGVVAPASKFVPQGYVLAPGYGAPDSDGDGVPDPEDPCPENPGPFGGGACPVPPTPPLPDPGDGSGPRCATSIGGTDSADSLRGIADGERIRGGDGDDRINGGGGDDCISGQEGDDRLGGGKGEDLIRGGKGNDRVRAADGEVDRIVCGDGRKDRATVDRRDKVSGCEKVKKIR